ncbi:hypothetical protein MRB53_018404 [Persea americana]|uniref:Uncharacterized protein n=1 Tax=Persea americana TaxID=3435 RepID=A0ACC2M7T6_PERAE|nr:hypothetical protein MRB53_018404 [Persea americana]
MAETVVGPGSGSGSSTAYPLQGRVAIVTGASRGIGRTVALHLASLGANLVLNYATSSAQADLLAAEISSSPSRAVAFQANVSVAAQVKSLFDQAESAFSAQPHILVNCAGVLDPKYPTLAATAEEDWDNTFSINVKGAFLCSKEAANRLVRCGGGRIICFTSSQVAALRPGYAAYTASKAAVEAMTKILAKELRGTQITANCVAPGPIATDMFFSGKTEEDVKRVVGICPLGRLGQTEDVAPLVGFLATDAAEWINGQISPSSTPPPSLRPSPLQTSLTSQPSIPASSIFLHQMHAEPPSSISLRQTHASTPSQSQQRHLLPLPTAASPPSSSPAMAETGVGSSTAYPLQGRVAIVTGASRGIGRTVALHLASLGANLVLNYATSSAQADLLAAEISSSPSPSRAVAVQANVSVAAQVKSLFDQAESAFSAQPHILVNCAGVLDPKYPTLAATAEEDWDNIFAVNAKGSFLCSKEAANRLVRGGGGRIICFTTSLVAALRPGFAAYTASKAAVEAMTKILAKELKGTQITANCVAPGPIATDMFFAGKTEEDVKRVVDICPLGRLGQTEDLAPLVGFLATDAAEWINGQESESDPDRAPPTLSPGPRRNRNRRLPRHWPHRRPPPRFPGRQPRPQLRHQLRPGRPSRRRDQLLPIPLPRSRLPGQRLCRCPGQIPLRPGRVRLFRPAPYPRQLRRLPRPQVPTLAATSEEDWDNTFAINIKGAFLCSKEAANRLVRGGGGRIICFTSSLVGVLFPGYAAYTASKAAVEAMTKILAKELKGTQITANCVAPGPIATNLFFAGKTEEDVKRVAGICPLGRLGQTEDVAPLVGFLATDSAEWINGQVIRINGGFV